MLEQQKNLNIDLFTKEVFLLIEDEIFSKNWLINKFI